jgi:multidrug resistance efflux pump
MLGVGIHFILQSLRESAAPPEPATTPRLEEAPARVYGLIEPRGREVFVGPLQSRRVIEVRVREGQAVTAGQPICLLDADIERHAVAVAELRAVEAEHRISLNEDNLRRNEKLAPSRAVSESELVRTRLIFKLEQQQLATARAETELRRCELDKLTLRSPIDGYVYKMDVRVGEQLTPQDYSRIVLGKREKQVRMFVEVFWMGRVRVGDRFAVREAESLRHLGTGRVVEVLPYVGTRDFRTEDRLERLDTKYVQVILELESPQDVAIGLLVLCERVEIAPEKQ